MKNRIGLNIIRRLIYLVLFLFFGCEKDSINKSEITEFNNKWDLEQIKASGTLRALTVYSGTSYFLYKGRPMGYEFELLERFAEYLDVDLEMIVVKNINEQIAVFRNEFRKSIKTEESALKAASKELAKKRDEIKKGDAIVTAGGIHGVVTEYGEENLVISVENQARLRIEKSSIAMINGEGAGTGKK